MEESHKRDEATMPDYKISMHGEFILKNKNNNNNGGDNNISIKNPEINAVQLVREIEKRKIREEIIATEMMMNRRQELEAEVRMELMMEKQLLGMRNFYGFSSSSSSSSYLDHHVMLMKPRFLGFHHSPNYSDYLLNLGVSDDEFVEGKMKLSSRGSVDGFMEIEAQSLPGDQSNVIDCEQKLHNIQDVALGKSPFDRDPRFIAAQIAGKTADESAENVVMAEVTPRSGITGVKRKAETAARACDEVRNSSMSKDSQKFYCSVCEVSATSETTLNAHFQGKKHRAKVANLKVDVTAVKPAGIMSLEPEKDGHTTDNTVQAMEPVSVMNSEQEKNLGINKWECSLCQLSVTSEILLKSHLQGKKHKAKKAKLQIRGTISNGEGLPSLEPQEGAEPSSNGDDADKKWYCSLCEVSASSEKNLNDHLKGKKHRAKAGLPQQDIDNLNPESADMVSVVEDVKEKTLSGQETPKIEGASPRSTVGNDKQKELDLTKNETTSSTLQADLGADDLKSRQLDEEKTETSLQPSKLEKDLEKGEKQNMVFVKYWHCKMCNKGTHDEATMAAHRKSNEHMTLLRKNGGGLICVANVLKEAVEH